jgi:hypothetical protein
MLAVFHENALAEGALTRKLRRAFRPAHLGPPQVLFENDHLIARTEIFGAEVIVLAVRARPVFEHGELVNIYHSWKRLWLTSLKRIDLEGDIIWGVFFLNFLELFFREHGGLTTIGRLALAHIAFEGGVSLRIVKETGIGIFQLFQEKVRNTRIGASASILLRGCIGELFFWLNNFLGEFFAEFFCR